MQPIPCARHRFPRDVIRHAMWLYLRFTLNYHDVEDLLVERGLGSVYSTDPLFRRSVIQNCLWGGGFGRDVSFGIE